MSGSVGKLLWAALIACYLHAGYSMAVSDDSSSLGKSNDDTNQQMESAMSKRDWHKSLPLWGKRAWQSLQGGWGKRDAWADSLYPAAEKRAWQNLQGGWGKRYAPDDIYALRLAAALAEQEEQEPQMTSDYSNDADLEPTDEEKRSWKSLSGSAWGKRSDWTSFRGSWGKQFISKSMKNYR
ncbi:Mip [Trypoxylus dichotomus]